MTRYRCFFQFYGAELEAVSERGLNAFTGGFWVDDDGKYTDSELSQQSNHTYWIAPSGIAYIRKEVIDDTPL